MGTSTQCRRPRQSNRPGEQSSGRYAFTLRRAVLGGVFPINWQVYGPAGEGGLRQRPGEFIEQPLPAVATLDLWAGRDKFDPVGRLAVRYGSREVGV